MSSKLSSSNHLGRKDAMIERIGALFFSPGNNPPLNQKANSEKA